MIKQQLHKQLLNAGLSEVEAAVYMELTKKPAATKWELVERTQLPKSSVYRAIEALEEMKLVKGLEAQSLSALVAELNSQTRALRKTAIKLKELAPYLQLPGESVEMFESLYSVEQIKEAYIYMSELNYRTQLDFGDFESFISRVASADTLGIDFMRNRVSGGAKCQAFLTTTGPNTQFFQKDSDYKEKQQAEVEILPIDFRNQYIVFSDEDDHVLLTQVDDDGGVRGQLVKSRMIADMQRQQLRTFSQRFGKA